MTSSGSLSEEAPPPSRVMAVGKAAYSSRHGHPMALARSLPVSVPVWGCRGNRAAQGESNSGERVRTRTHRHTQTHADMHACAYSYTNALYAFLQKEQSCCSASLSQSKLSGSTNKLSTVSVILTDSSHLRWSPLNIQQIRINHTKSRPVVTLQLKYR